LGPKRQFEEKDARPVVDERVFGIDEVKEAY
jgi:hypothetical protein